MSCMPIRPPEDIPGMFIEEDEVAMVIDAPVAEAMDIVEDIDMSMPDMDAMSILKVEDLIVLQNKSVISQ